MNLKGKLHYMMHTSYNENRFSNDGFFTEVSEYILANYTENSHIPKTQESQLEWLPISDKKMNLPEAQDYAKSLNARLPEVWEMQKAFCNKETIFENDFFWSASPESAGFSFYFYGGDGHVLSNGHGNSYSVRCVRDIKLSTLDVTDSFSASVVQFSNGPRSRPPSRVCSHANIITNCANGQLFKVCTSCKEEV